MKKKRSKIPFVCNTKTDGIYVHVIMFCNFQRKFDYCMRGKFDSINFEIFDVSIYNTRRSFSRCTVLHSLQNTVTRLLSIAILYYFRRCYNKIILSIKYSRIKHKKKYIYNMIYL